MSNDKEDIWTDNQKSAIYKKVLMPVKLKISKILLYDTETALKFLQKYNEIVKDEENIIVNTVNLENEINQYLEREGNQIIYEDQNEIIVQQIEDLQAHCEHMPLVEFEEQLNGLKNIYDSNSKKYSVENRENIEKKLNSLQAEYIMKKVSLDSLFNIEEVITDDNKDGMTLYIYDEIIKLMQRDNPQIQNIANQLKIMISTNDDYIYNPRTWELLESAQKNSVKIVPDLVKNKINLPAIPNKKKRNPFLDKILGRRIKVGTEEMDIVTQIMLGDKVVKTKELSKIDINWLASNVSQQMLEDTERNKLKQEGKSVSEKYIPDARTPIYDFMSEEKDYYHEIQIHLHFCNQEGLELEMIGDTTDSVASWGYMIIEGKSGSKLKCSLSGSIEWRDLYSTNKYVKFIDSITNSNLSQIFANEIGVYFEKSAKGYDIKVAHKKVMEKLPIYQNLLKSYKKVKREYENTKLSFREQEKIKRDNFYKRNNFKDNVKIEPSSIQYIEKKEEEIKEIEQDNEIE